MSPRSERRLVRRYAIEIAIVGLGFGLALFEAVVVDQRSVAVVIAAIGLMLATNMLLMRKEIADALGDDIDRIVGRIAERWRDAALHRVRVLEEELDEWADGRRSLDGTERIQYQLNLVQRAESEVLAVHVAMERDKLALWDKETGGFNDFVEAQTKLAARTRRRVFVLNDDIEGLAQRGETGTIQLVDDMAIRVCRRQIDEMGFDLRIRWLSEGKPPRDLLIVDNQEAVVVDVGNVLDEYDAEALASPARVASQRMLFESTWQLAHPAAECLPALATTGEEATVQPSTDPEPT